MARHICAKFSKKSSIAVKRVIFAGCLAHDMLMDTRHSASCKVDILDREIEFFLYFFL